jgi:tetratricopeptide (TPR) repeat protein
MMIRILALAILVFLCACEQPKTARQLYDEAVSLSKQHEYDLATAKLAEAIDVDSSFAEAYYMRGSIHQSFGKHRQAIADFDTALYYGKAKTIRWAHFYRAMSHLRMRDSAEALSQLDSCTKYFSQNGTLQYYRGRLQYHFSKYSSADSSLTLAIKLNPDLQHAYYYRGQSREMMHRFSEACDDYREDLKINPDNKLSKYRLQALTPKLHKKLPSSVYDLHRYTLNEINEKIKIDPSNGYWFYRRAKIRPNTPEGNFLAYVDLERTLTFREQIHNPFVRIEMAKRCKCLNKKVEACYHITFAGTFITPKEIEEWREYCRKNTIPSPKEDQPESPQDEPNDPSLRNL